MQPEKAAYLAADPGHTSRGGGTDWGLLPNQQPSLPWNLHVVTSCSPDNAIRKQKPVPLPYGLKLEVSKVRLP